MNMWICEYVNIHLKFTWHVYYYGRPNRFMPPQLLWMSCQNKAIPTGAGRERGYITPPWIRAPQAARIAGGMEPARLVNKQCGIARNSSQALIPSTFSRGEKRCGKKCSPGMKSVRTNLPTGKGRGRLKRGRRQKLLHIADWGHYKCQVSSLSC